MKIDKSIYNPLKPENYTKEKGTRKTEVKSNEIKSDKLDLSSGYEFEMKSIDSNSESTPESNYIQLKYAEYKIRENAESAVAMYEGLSKDRVYSLL